MEHPKTTEQKVINFIKQQNFNIDSKKILVALSGGADSVFALFFLHKYQNKYKINLAAAHINHSLRGKESDRDELFCYNICKKLNVDFFTKRVDVKTFAKKTKKSIEEAARFLRYEALSQLAEEAKADFIITAHNIDDNTETVLLNLISGTSIDGLAGIPVKRDNILRPFLCIDKTNIEQYLIKKKIKFIKDSTNKNLEFKRNFLRKKILPPLKEKLNPSLNKSIFQTSEVLANQKKLLDFFIKSVITEVVQQKKSEIYISLQKMKNYPKEIMGDVFKIIFKEQLKFEFNYKKFLKLNHLFNSQTGTNIELGKNLIAIKDREFLVIKFCSKPDKNKNMLKVNETLSFEDKKISIEKSINSFEKHLNNRNIEIIAADNLSSHFFLRRWEKGDKIQPLGMKNYRNISDLLADLKVPSHKKKEQLVLVNNNEVIWLVGFIISDKVKITSKTKNFLKLCLN